jgi:carbon starvation protein
VTFGLLGTDFGTALGFGVFVVIVLTVVQLVFRLMRVTLGEWLGGAWVGFKNQHVASIIGMVLVLGLVLTGTWVYLWQLFGASNQLLAALSLLIVTVWLVSVGKNAAYAGVPMVFMYVTTIAAAAVTAFNLYQSIIAPGEVGGVPVAGAWAMIVVAVLLIVAALVIAADGFRAYGRFRREPVGEVAPGTPAAAPRA